MEEPQKCIDGWSAWINKDKNVKGRKLNDIEQLPNWIDLVKNKDDIIMFTYLSITKFEV